MATSDENKPVLEPTTGSMSERRASIDKKLQQRPDQQELKDKHILLKTNAAPALQASQHELEKQQMTDELRKKLGRRPEREDLVANNILPDSTAAPALQAQQKELQKHMRQNSLEKQLQGRPDMNELVKQGILLPEEANKPAAEAGAVDDS